MKPVLHIDMHDLVGIGSATLCNAMMENLRERFILGCIIDRLIECGRIFDHEVIGIETGYFAPKNGGSIQYWFPERSGTSCR